MKQFWMGIIGAVVLGALVFIGVREVRNRHLPENDKPTVKIGVIFSLTGADPEGANNAKNALIYVAEQLKSSPLRYEFVFEDSHGEPIKGINAAKKLITYDKVNVVLSNISAVSKAIAPYLNKEKALHIAFSSDRETAEGKTNFVFWISAEEYADKMVKLLKKQGYKNAIALVNSDATSMQRYDALKKVAADNQIELKKTEFVPGTRDFRLAIHQAINEMPDVIVLLAPLPELDIIGQQLAEVGNTVPLTSMDFFNYSKHKGLFEGSYYVSTGDGNKNTVDIIMNVIQAKNPFSLAYMNDAVNLIDKAGSDFYNKNKRLATGDELAESLISLQNYNGAVGDVVIDTEGVISPQAVIKKIINNVPVIVEE